MGKEREGSSEALCTQTLKELQGGCQSWGDVCNTPTTVICAELYSSCIVHGNQHCSISPPHNHPVITALTSPLDPQLFYVALIGKLAPRMQKGLMTGVPSWQEPTQHSKKLPVSAEALGHL